MTRTATASATAFSIGDRVQSSVDTQGLTRGMTYKVVDLEEQSLGIFGTFVTYLLEDDQGNRIPVRNGHLLLTRAEPRDQQ